VLPTNSGQGYQEFICGTQGRESTLDNAMSECEAFGLTPTQAASEVLRVIAVVNTWQAHFRSMGVSSSDMESLAQQIDGDYLLNQRQGFDAAKYTGASAKRARKNPFSSAS
jgi:serine/threonine-protein kinase HipA